ERERVPPGTAAHVEHAPARRELERVDEEPDLLLGALRECVAQVRRPEEARNLVEPRTRLHRWHLSHEMTTQLTSATGVSAGPVPGPSCRAPPRVLAHSPGLPRPDPSESARTPPPRRRSGSPGRPRCSRGCRRAAGRARLAHPLGAGHL